jgi:cytochrome c-type biogenesis protein CcmH/NrfG
LTAAYRGLGIIYAALGNRSKARENFRQAARLSPSESTELLNMSIFDAEEGAESLSKVLSAHPTAEGYAQLGQLLRLSRRMPDAQVAYEKALRLNPNLVEAKQALQELKGAAQ